MSGTPTSDARGTARRVRRLAAFLVILGIQFGLFETALRVWGSSEAAPSFQGLFENDPTAGYRLKPNARVRFTTSEFDTEIAINGQGVRDDEEIGPKGDDERRVVVLGDSLVLSVQVPFGQTFCELLEQRLNAGAGAAGVRYRVINAGVQGYGPVEELLFFRSIVDRLQPDLVIVTTFVGNDAEEAFRTAPKLQGDTREVSSAVTDSLTTRLRRIVRRSMVLQILRLRALSATERFRGTMAAPEPPLQSYAADPAPRIGEGLAIARDCVKDIAALAATQGAKTAVALMPARFQVDDADYRRLDDAMTQAGGVLLRDGASDRFARTMATLQLPTIDLLPALRSSLPGQDLFFQQTVHLTPRGHVVVAAALDKFVREQGLLTLPGGRDAR